MLTANAGSPGGTHGRQRSPGKSGYYGVIRINRSLAMQSKTAWGRMVICALPSAELGARLYDTTLLWRAMRLGAGAKLGAGGKPRGTACLPPPHPGSLPPNLNFPAERYLGDAALMEFLGRASYAELEAHLRQELKAAKDAEGTEQGQRARGQQAGAGAGAGR